MASVNKVILVGNLGRDPSLRYLPDSVWADQARRALEQMERSTVWPQGWERVRRLLSRLAPLLRACQRLGDANELVSRKELQALMQDRERLLAVLQFWRQDRRPHVVVQVASLNRRVLMRRDARLACRSRHRCAGEHRACQARYSLLRFGHFLPAAAALVSLS